MNSKDGALHFQPSLELSKLKADVARMKREITGVTTHGRKESELLSSSVRKALIGATGGYLSFIGAKRFVSDIISIRGQFEQLQVAFETMLKSKSKANAMMREVVEFAAKTPFQLTEVAGGTKQLLAYRIEQEKIIPTLKALGDVSAGLSVPIGRLILNYGQVKTAAKLTGRELRDFNMAGVPLIAELAKNLGKTENEITSMVSAGRIGFKDVENAFKSMTSEGGRFSDLMDKQAKTITGRISNIKDNLDKMFNDIGEANQGAINSAISGVGYLIEHYEDIGREIGALITAYGSYRAALIVTTALQGLAAESAKGYTLAQTLNYRALLLAEKAQKALNKTMLANPYVAVGVAVASLSYLVYKLATAASAAEVAQEKLNNRIKEQEESAKKEKEEVKRLIDVIKDEVSTRTEKQDAINKLQILYPDFFKNLDEEAVKQMKIADALKHVNEEQEKKIRLSDEETIRQNKKEIKRLKSRVRIEVGAKDETDEREIARLEEFNKQLEAKLFKDWKAKEQGRFNSLPTKDKRREKVQENAALELEIKQLKAKREEQLKSSGYASEALKIEIKAKQDLVTANEKLIEGYNKETKGYKTAKQEIADWSEKIKELNEERKKLLSAKISPVKRTEELKKIDGKIAEFEGKIKSRNKNYGKGKEDKSTYDSSTAKREEKRTLEDLENQKQKLILEMMQEGAAKSLAQLRLNNKLKLQEIRRAYEDEILEIEEKEKEKKKALGKNYSPKEGNENKAGVSKAYNMLISNASKANASNEDALFSQMIKSRDEKREEDLRNYQSYVQSYIDKSKEFEQNIKNLQNQGFSEETIAQVKELQKDSLDKLDEQMEIKEEYIVALANEMIGLGVEELIAKLEEAEAALSVEKNIGKEDYDKKAHYERVQRLQNQIKILKEQLSKAGTEKVKDSSDKMNLQQTFQLLRDINSAAGDAIEGFEGMSDATKDVFKSAFAISSATITMIGGISDLASWSIKATKMTAEGASQAIQKVEKASVILAIASAALQIIEKITSLVGGNQKKHREAILKLKKEEVETQRELNRLMFEWKILMADAESVFGVNEISKATGYLAVYNERLEQLHDKIKNKKWSPAKLFGIELKTVGKFATELDNIQIKTGHRKGNLFRRGKDYFSSITKVYGDILDANGELDIKVAKAVLSKRSFRDGHKERLEEIIELYEQAEKAQELFSKYMKDTFGELGTSIVDGVIGSLSKGEDAFVSFSKSVSNIMGKLGKQLMYELFVSSKFKDLEGQIKKIYNTKKSPKETAIQVREAVGSFANAVKGDIELMKAFGKSWQEESKKLGFEVWNGENQKREASKGAFSASFTQDQASSIDSRFATMQVHTYDTSQNTKGIFTTMNTLYSVNAEQLRVLVGIKKNTKTMKNDISAIKDAMEDVSSQGIKVKR